MHEARSGGRNSERASSSRTSSKDRSACCFALALVLGSGASRSEARFLFFRGCCVGVSERGSGCCNGADRFHRRCFALAVRFVSCFRDCGHDKLAITGTETNGFKLESAEVAQLLWRSVRLITAALSGKAWTNAWRDRHFGCNGHCLLHRTA